MRIWLQTECHRRPRLQAGCERRRAPAAAPARGTPATAMADVRDIARRGFIYGLATIDLYRILRNFALDPASAEFKAPLNADLPLARSSPIRADRSIVAMNVDTPYSYAWLDLRAEPVVLDMPPFDAERYVSAQIIDLYTYIVGYVSPRTNGHDGGSFLIAGPALDRRRAGRHARSSALPDRALPRAGPHAALRRRRHAQRRRAPGRDRRAAAVRRRPVRRRRRPRPRSSRSRRSTCARRRPSRRSACSPGCCG